MLPASMISIVLVPLIKTKSDSICSKDNYRPIALASIISKVFEYIIFERIKHWLHTYSNKFGIKKKHGTDMCIYALKESVAYLSIAI